MPSINTIIPLSAGKYYHIFNRGINRNPIFYRQENYIYFLFLWKKYLADYTHVLAYCLLPNHFHFLVKLTEKIVVKNEKNEVYEIVEEEYKVGEIISEKLRRLFISYSQAINRQESRSGSLLTRNFKRIELEDDEHLKYLFFYIHNNPCKHGLTNDFRDYRYSSLKAYLSQKSTSIYKELGFEIFGGKDEFVAFHNYYHEEKESLILE